ncbi:hypothetical protein E2C01_004092 [Portunus trituberculatus]|uniref:Uncharacterized protein n=1 Tax=Portunus trituberculatus TaxID=210409 RepID=A0A5B7CT20_PORTR|nr:hypothetical protein [Portunus trituberculatus]
MVVRHGLDVRGVSPRKIRCEPPLFRLGPAARRGAARYFYLARGEGLQCHRRGLPSRRKIHLVGCESPSLSPLACASRPPVLRSSVSKECLCPATPGGVVHICCGDISNISTVPGTAMFK